MSELDDGEHLHGVANNGEHCCLCGGEHASIGYGETYSTCANCYDAFIDSEPWGRDEGLAKLRAEYARRVSNMLATVPKEKTMNETPITPERLRELDAGIEPNHAELRELLRVYRSHLAQPEPDRSEKPAFVKEVLSELRSALAACDVCGGVAMVFDLWKLTKTELTESLAWLDRRPAGETNSHGDNECPRRETIRRAEAEADEQAAKVRACEARIADLEFQLTNEQRALRAYREEAQRIDKARDEQLATLTTERDQAWENRNMLRRELEAVKASRLTDQAAFSRSCEQLRAEALRLNELGKTTEIDLNVERAKTARLTWELQAERANVAGVASGLRHLRTRMMHERCLGWVQSLDAALDALQPAAPKEAKEVTTVSVPAEEEGDDVRAYCAGCGARLRSQNRFGGGVMVAPHECPKTRLAAKEQAPSEHDAEQEKRLEDMRATLDGSVSLGAFGSILLQYLRAEREATR